MAEPVPGPRMRHLEQIARAATPSDVAELAKDWRAAARALVRASILLDAGAIAQAFREVDRAHPTLLVLVRTRRISQQIVKAAAAADAREN